jgi:hypothetical protein
VLWRRSLDAVVLLPTGADDVVTLAGTGVDVWELLDTWRSPEALGALLADAYGADPAEVEADVGLLLGYLEEVGALETLAADSGGPATG